MKTGLLSIEVKSCPALSWPVLSPTCREKPASMDLALGKSESENESEGEFIHGLHACMRHLDLVLPVQLDT